MKFDIHKPWYLNREPIEEIFLLDSFGQTDWQGRRYSYIKDALQYVWWRTGLVCIAVQANGAGYRDLLNAAKQAGNFIRERGGIAPQFAVIISMGNDVYGKADCNPESIAKGMAEVCNRVFEKNTSIPNLVVFGGSSRVWGHTGKFAETYDSNVKIVLWYLQNKYDTLAIQGEGLGALKVTDRIGHVHADALPTVIRMYAAWARLAKAMARNQSSKL